MYECMYACVISSKIITWKALSNSSRYATMIEKPPLLRCWPLLQPVDSRSGSALGNMQMHMVKVIAKQPCP